MRLNSLGSKRHEDLLAGRKSPLLTGWLRTVPFALLLLLLLLLWLGQAEEAVLHLTLSVSCLVGLARRRRAKQVESAFLLVRPCEAVPFGRRRQFFLQMALLPGRRVVGHRKGRCPGHLAVLVGKLQGRRQNKW